MARILCLTVIATALLLFSATALGSAPVVPSRVQQAIKRHDAQLAFIPTRVPVGYRYAKWSGSRIGYEIWFDNRERAPLDLGYQALRESCSSFGEPMRTFKVNGVRVYWSGTYEDQQAWRRLTRGHTTIALTSSRSVPGDDATTTPAQKRDALDLVRLVAYARRAG